MVHNNRFELEPTFSWSKAKARLRIVLKQELFKFSSMEKRSFVFSHLSHRVCLKRNPITGFDRTYLCIPSQILTPLLEESTTWSLFVSVFFPYLATIVKEFFLFPLCFDLCNIKVNIHYLSRLKLLKHFCYCYCDGLFRITFFKIVFPFDIYN